MTGTNERYVDFANRQVGSRQQDFRFWDAVPLKTDWRPVDFKRLVAG